MYRAVFIILLILFPYTSFYRDIIITLKIYPTFKNLGFPFHVVIDVGYVGHTKKASKGEGLICIAV